MIDHLDEVRADREQGALRRSLLTGALLPKGQMIRFVVAPDGGVVCDLHARLPGRGAWVACSRAELADVIKKQAFKRSFKQKLAVTDVLLDQVERALRSAFLAQLGLARRQGVLALGQDTVAQLLDSAQLGLLVLASDAGEAQRAKFRLEKLKKPALLLDQFPREVLSAAVGHENTVYLAVKSSILPASLRLAAARMLCYEGALTVTDLERIS